MVGVRDFSIKVQKVEPKGIFSTRPLPDTFVYKPIKSVDKRSKVKSFVEKQCMKILQRMGVLQGAHETVRVSSSYESVSVDLDHLEREIQNNRRSLMQLYHRDVSMIICNSEHVCAMRELEPMRFNYPYVSNIRMVDSRDDARTQLDFRGIPVVVIPWVDSIILVPKLD
jgi:hypothetical protein